MEPTVGGADFWSMLSGATLVVQVVLGILAVMSLISWYLIFYKYFLLTSARKRAAQDFDSFTEAASLNAAMQAVSKNRNSPLYEIGLNAVKELKKFDNAEVGEAVKGRVAMDNLRRVLRQSISGKLRSLGASLSFLATCSNAAPFIGLFGTVWGIMHAFHSIGQQKTAALAAVAPGISEALVATAIGLAVAIPATIAYNVFLGMLNSVEVELVNFAGAFLNRVQRELPWITE